MELAIFQSFQVKCGFRMISHVDLNMILMSILYDFECGHLYDYDFDYECQNVYDFECYSYMTTNVGPRRRMCGRFCHMSRYFPGIMVFRNVRVPPNSQMIRFCCDFHVFRILPGLLGTPKNFKCPSFSRVS